MLNKYLPKLFFSLIILFVLKANMSAQTPCPTYSDVLNHGWAAIPPNHNPGNGNMDEFAVTYPSPFMVKVNDYPPVKAFPITKSCGSFYYFSFDTDDNYFPINYKMPRNQPNSVKTYRFNLAWNIISGYRVTVTPPESWDVGHTSPDFVMKYNGTMHDAAWNLDLYPWSDFVSTPALYFPQPLTIEILGPGQLNYGTAAEYTVDINGGAGNYDITWWKRVLPNGNWMFLQQKSPENYYTIPYPNGENYYFYVDEHKYNVQMDDYALELQVQVYDADLQIFRYATKIINASPEPVTFINHIEASENFGELILNENKLDPIVSGTGRNLLLGTNYTVRTDELPFLVNWNSTGKTEKHLRWEFNNPNIQPINVLNNNFIFLPSSERTMKARFQSTDQAIIRTIIDEIPCGTIDFKDPWYYYKDVNNNWYQSNEFRTYTSPLNLFNNSASSYGGVFRNQDYNNPGNPFYTVKAPSGLYIPQTGSTHELNLVAWLYDPNEINVRSPYSEQADITFKLNNAELTAYMKGHLLSNDQNGISSGSQRKLVRTDNGIYHLVYESMGSIFYTHSLTSDFYGSWADEFSLELDSKNPSMDYEGDTVKVVYETTEVLLDSTPAIYLATLIPGAGGQYHLYTWELITSIPLSYFGNAKPVVAYSSSVIYVAYRKNNTNGIYQRSKIYRYGEWQQWMNEELIPNTNSNSKNPTIASKSGYSDVHLAYEHSFSIKYILSSFHSDGWQYAYYSTISTGSGFDYNHSPSISLAGIGYSVVSWIGYNNIIPPDKFGKIEAIEYVPKVVVRRGLLNWSSFFKAGNNAIAANNNSITETSTEATVVTWSEGITPDNTSKWVRRVDGIYTDAHSLSHNGKQTQVSNGTSLNNIEGVVFSSISSPYSLLLTTTDFNQTFSEGGDLDKVSDYLELSYGREGIINKNGIEFLFNIGDIFVSDSAIKFIEEPDTVIYTTTEELNRGIKTEPFYLSSNTEFYFTNFYYVLNNELADTSLNENDLVNFKVELVSTQTSEVVGTFDNITYTKEQLEKYNNISYKVDCNSITPDNYYLRLVTNVEGEAEYYLGNVQNNGAGLNKKSYKEINFNGLANPVDYELAQNYPNPFNPSTTIKYQIPQDGMVTMKIYDILGKEVKTLINEQKSIGRYEVNFDASDLASGVYIYRIQVNDYVAAKKMMLLK